MLGLLCAEYTQEALISSSSPQSKRVGPEAAPHQHQSSKKWNKKKMLECAAESNGGKGILNLCTAETVRQVFDFMCYWGAVVDFQYYIGGAVLHCIVLVT